MFGSPSHGMKTLAGALLCAGLVATAAAQQRGGAGSPLLAGRGGAIPGLGGPYELLAREDVRKELELADEQVRQLEGLRDKLRERLRDEIAKSRQQRGEGDESAPRDRARESLRQMVEHVNAEINKELSRILLPHQLKRLDQLALQMRLNYGLAAFGGDVAQQLGITDQQRELLRARSEELERDMRRRIEEMRRDAQNQLLSVLTPEQQAKVREMIGKPFDFGEPDRRAAAQGPVGAVRDRN